MAKNDDKLTQVQRVMRGEQKSEGNVSAVQAQGVLEGGGTLQMMGLFAEVNPIADEPAPETPGQRGIYIHDEPSDSPAKIQLRDIPAGAQTGSGNPSKKVDADKLDEDRQERVRNSRNTMNTAEAEQAAAFEREAEKDKLRSREPIRDVEDEEIEKAMGEGYTGPTSARGVPVVEKTQAFAAEQHIRERQQAQYEAVAEGGAPAEERFSDKDTEELDRDHNGMPEDFRRDTNTVEGYSAEARKAELDDMKVDELKKHAKDNDIELTATKKAEIIDEIVAAEGGNDNDLVAAAAAGDHQEPIDSDDEGERNVASADGSDDAQSPEEIQAKDNPAD